MKYRVLIIILTIIFLSIVTVFIMRHKIIGHAFKVSIREKTNSTVELNIGHLYFDLFSSTVTITNSDFAFQNVYVDEKKSISLSELKFDELSLENLSLFKLIFRHEFIANKVIIDKPSFWFLENNNPKPFRERPKEIIGSLKKHPDMLGSLVVVIGEIEITHGKVDLSSIIDDDENKGSVEFKLLLKDINTQDKELFTEESFLFARHHFFKLSNFNYLLPNGDRLGFDSLVFGSHSNLISISNVDLAITDTSKHSKVKAVTARINNIDLFGIDVLQMNSFRDFYLDSLKISDVGLKLIHNPNATPKKTSSDNMKAGILNFLRSINLSKLILEEVDIIAGNSDVDSIILIEDMNFQVSDIVFDSASFSQKLPRFNSKSILLSLDDFLLSEEEFGLNVHFSDLDLDENNSTLYLSEVHIDDHKNGDHSYLIDADSLEVQGISLDSHLRNENMNLGLLIYGPEVNIDIYQIKKRESKSAKNFMDKIVIDNVHITDGNIHVDERDKLKVDINGFNLSWDSINFTDPSNINSVNPNGAELSLVNMQVELPEIKSSFGSHYIEVKNDMFQINSLSASIKLDNKLITDFSIANINAVGTDIRNILINKQINFDRFIISQPIIRGKVFSAKEPKKMESDSAKSKFDYSIDINSFDIVEGNIDFEMDYGSPSKIKSGIFLKSTNINITDYSSLSWLHNIGWDLNLINTWVETEDYQLTCDKLVSDKNKELLLIDGFHLYERKEFRHIKRFEIVEFALPKVILDGLSYSSIIENMTPLIGSATIENASINLKIDTRIKKKRKHSTKIVEKLPFELDQLSLKGMAIVIDKQDSISISNLSVGSIDIDYKLDSSLNLIDDVMYFDISDMVISDTIKNTSMNVERIVFDEENNSIGIVNLVGGNIHHDSLNNYLSYNSPEISLNNVYLSHSFPTNIGFDKISIAGGNAHVSAQHKKNSDKKIVNKSIVLPDFIGTIKVSSFIADSINFNHSMKADSVVKEMSLINIGIGIDSLFVNSSILAKNDYSNYAKGINLFLGSNKFITKDSLYEANLQNINYDFNNATLTLDSLTMMPRFEDEEFFERAVYQTGRMKVIAGNIVCSDFKLNTLITDNKLNIGAVDMYDLSAQIFRNKMYDMNPNAFKPMPQEMILNIPITVVIDSLVTHDAYISYKEIDKNSVVPGELFLNKFNLSILNISNDRELLVDSSKLVAKLNAMLLGQANLRIYADFPILSPTYEFSVKGHMEKLDFPKLNNLTENLVGVTMARGSGTLDIPLIKGNAINSEGEILFKYKKLKIELYNREKAKTTKGLVGSMANLLLNDIIIKSNNPGFLGRKRPGEVYFKRNTEKSIISYIWKSIMSGLMSTMGYNNKEQRQEMRAYKRAYRKANK